jgi:hypothetical protein
MLRILQFLWAAPVSLIGLVFAAIILVTNGQAQRVGRAWEITGGCAPTLLRILNPRLSIIAIVFGHVIIATDCDTATRLRAHEHMHVRQYERFGVLMPLLYVASSAWAWLKGGDAYLDNVFEREAIAAESSKKNT